MRFLDYDGLQQFLRRLRTIIPTKTSDLTNDSGFLTSHNPIDSSLSETSENAIQNKVVKDALNGKSDTGHTHLASEVSGLSTVATSGSYSDLTNKPTIDSALSSTSANAVQNKVIKGALDSKSDTGHTHTKSEITDFPTLSTVATSGSYNDLSNKPTIPTVNNKTLTIKKNGTSVAAFTANSNKDVSADITVPTKVSELTNDSGYLTSHQSLADYSTKADTIKDLSISGKVITYTKGDDTTGTLTTQDTVYTHPTTAGNKHIPSGGSANQYLKYSASGTATWATIKTSELNNDSGFLTSHNPVDSALSTTSENAVQNKAVKAELDLKANSTDLSTVATTGSYTDLNNIPSNFTPASHTHGSITNDGKLGTASRALITDGNKKIAVSSVTSTELGYLSGVTSAVQDQLDGKAASTHSHAASDVSGLATVATSGSYDDLSNKPTIPTVNNAKLTIQRNGTTVKTFTANASSNVTANITVPTKVSELTNDSGFLTSHNPVDSALSDTSTNAVQNKVVKGALDGKSDTGHTHTASEVSGLSTVATSGSYNDLSNKPTIPTVNNATLTIQKNGTTVKTFTANASSNVTANITVPTKVSELTNDSGYLTSASNLDSSKLTGTIDIARLPKGALERLVTVADQTARFALTTSDVQLGDTVKQLDTGVMYIVTDESKLSSADGYTEYTAGAATSVPWSGVTGKPSSYTPSSHSHGNIANGGTLGTASRALITDGNKKITTSSVTSTELGYVSGVTSAIQTQLNGKAASSHTHTASEVSGLSTVATSGSYNDLSNKPTIDSALSSTSTNAVQNKVINSALSGKAASSHTHTKSQITDFPTKTSQFTNDSHQTITVGADTTSTASPAHSGTFTCIDSVTRDSNGHVTAVNTTTVTLPADSNTDTKVTNTLGTTTKAYITGTTSNKTNTGTQIFDTGVYLSTTAGELVATKFTGALNGNANTATQFSANKSVTLTGDVSGTASSKAGWSVATTLSDSGVTAGTYGPSADVTGNNNATISVPEITVDSKGRVTSVANRTLTCKNNTYNVYNKTLTIQKNGTSVATFTSNSNTDVTANITVPTKTSELTNDSGFLTSHQDLSLYPYKVTSFTSYGNGRWPYIDLGDTTTHPNGFNEIVATGKFQVRWTNATTVGVPFTTSAETDGILEVDGISSASGVSSYQRVVQRIYRQSSPYKVYFRYGAYHDGTWNWSDWTSYGDIVSHNASEFLTSINAYLENNTARDADAIDKNGITYYNSNGPDSSLGATTDDGALFTQFYNSKWIAQIAQDYRNGNLFTRGKNNNTWQAWKAVAYHGDNVSKFTNDAGYLTSHQSLANYSTLANTIKSLSISGRTITYTKGDNTTGTLTTQDNNTWTAMVGATSSANGSVGYVNAVPPKNGYNTKYLRADGTWAVPPDHTYTVNNATLTIQKNGTNVATFTSNASSNATANITVPTKTSELTNDSGFLTSHQSLAGYLPLTGGTMTGDLTIKGAALKFSSLDTTEGSTTYRTDTLIKSVSSNTKYGLNVLFGSSGGAILGAGEGKDSLLTELAGATPEDVYIIADGSIYFHPNANTYANKKTVTLDTSANLSGLTTVTATTFSGALTGNVTGNCSGSSGSCTGNAATATQFSANKSVTLTGDVTGTASSKAGWSVATTLANSGVTAGTYGPSADVTGNNNATISVPQITVDAKGRVTSVTNRTLTCKNNTYTVNNATLTIQKNGTNVATFTSNASANATANIVVPTKVSELTNDSGFLTEHQDLSLYPFKMDSLSNGGTYEYADIADEDHIEAGFGGFTTTGIYRVRTTSAVPDAPTTSTVDGNLIVINSGSAANVSSYRRCRQIFIVNTRYGTVYHRIGSYASGAWTWYDWVQDVNTVLDQEISGIKTLKSHLRFSSTNTRGTAPSKKEERDLIDFKDSAGNRIFLIDSIYNTDKSSLTSFLAYNTTVATGSNIGGIAIGCDASGNAYTTAITPDASDDSTKIATTAWVNAKGYLTSHQSLDNFVTLDTEQTITGTKHTKTTYADVMPKTETFPGSTRYYISQRDYAYNYETLFLSYGFVQTSGTNVRRWYVYPYSSGDTAYFQIDVNADASDSNFKIRTKTVIPANTNDTDLGTSSKIWKSIYANNYYLGTTAFGDIVTHNASEFLTSHQSLNNYVTLNSAQTISGVKTISAADLKFSTTETRGTAPSADISKEITTFDSAGNAISKLGAYYCTDKHSETRIYAYKTTQATGGNIGYLGIGCNTSGNVYTFAPTPATSDNSTQIATTAFVKAQGYLTSHQSLSNYSTLANTVKSLSISGKTITVTPGSGSAYTLTTQDTVYTHPTTAGNKHIPSGGAANQYLKYSASGTAVWANLPSIPTKTSDLTNDSHQVITTSADTTSAETPTHSGTFTCIDSVTRDSNGHVTTVNTKTITLPADSNTDTKVTQTVTTANSNYPIILGNTTSQTATETSGARFTAGAYINARYATLRLANVYNSDALKGTRPTSTRQNLSIQGYTKDDALISQLRAEMNKAGLNRTYIETTNWIKDGAVATDGTATTCGLYIDVLDNGTKQISTTGLWASDLTPVSNNSKSLGTTDLRWKECYANAYFLGTTAFGDIVTHNASEFLTSHQSLANYVTLNGNQTISGNKTFSGTLTGNLTGNCSGTSANVTGKVAIANGGTGATDRLNAFKNLTSEPVSSPTHFIGITSNWAKVGYTTIAQAKSVLGVVNVTQTATSNDSSIYPLLLGKTANASASETTTARFHPTTGLKTDVGVFYTGNSAVNITKGYTGTTAVDQGGICTRLGDNTTSVGWLKWTTEANGGRYCYISSRNYIKNGAPAADGSEVGCTLSVGVSDQGKRLVTATVDYDEDDNSTKVATTAFVRSEYVQINQFTNNGTSLSAAKGTIIFGAGNSTSIVVGTTYTISAVNLFMVTNTFLRSASNGYAVTYSLCATPMSSGTWTYLGNGVGGDGVANAYLLGYWKRTS